MKLALGVTRGLTPRLGNGGFVMSLERSELLIEGAA
jgi:hypothetical protein